MIVSSTMLPRVHFPEWIGESARQWDLRRLRGGERNTRFGPSPINGRGSFASQRISRSAPVLVREPLSGHYPVNHSRQPNTARAVNRSGLFALRPIASGEEITEDYRFLPYFGQAIPVLPQLLPLGSVAHYVALLRRHRFELEAGHTADEIRSRPVLVAPSALVHTPPEAWLEESLPPPPLLA